MARMSPRQKREQYRQLWWLGWEYAEIASVLGVTRRTLYYWRIQLMLEPRKRGPAQKELRSQWQVLARLI
jgi:uncharacterized protein YjcR